jgi:catalase
MRFTNEDGHSRFGRYRIVPEAGNEHLSDADVAGRDKNYLFDELKARVSSGPIAFRVMVQLAASGDVVDDATVHWPEDRPVADFGRLVLTAPVADSDVTQKRMIFDPVPRVDGIDPSDDPLIELRAAIYLLSGRRRRAA